MPTPIVDFFDKTIDKHGWKIIAIRPRSKIPAFKKWTGPYWPDTHRNYLLDNPHANIGILLGDVLDIEADTEKSNEMAGSLIGNIPHLIYKSERSFHHLFINPFRNLKKIVWKGIEFRANAHQSILPPSIGRNGIQYEWVDENSPICLPPDNIIRLIKQLVSYQPDLVSPRCSVCNKEIKMAKSRFNLEVVLFSKMGYKWIGKCCRKHDLRHACRVTKKQI